MTSSLENINKKTYKKQNDTVIIIIIAAIILYLLFNKKAKVKPEIPTAPGTAPETPTAPGAAPTIDKCDCYKDELPQSIPADIEQPRQQQQPWINPNTFYVKSIQFLKAWNGQTYIVATMENDMTSSAPLIGNNFTYIEIGTNRQLWP